MNLLSYYKSWSSTARWWLLLVGGVSSWALSPLPAEAGRPGLVPAVQTAPVEPPQMIEVVPQAAAGSVAPASANFAEPTAPAGMSPLTDKNTSRRPVATTGPAVPVPSGPVPPTVPVPLGATRSDTPAPVAATTGSSRRKSPSAPRAAVSSLPGRAGQTGRR